MKFIFNMEAERSSGVRAGGDLPLGSARPLRPLAADEVVALPGQPLLVLEHAPPDLRRGREGGESAAEGLDRQPTVVTGLGEGIESEGVDRPSLELPGSQSTLLADAIRAAHLRGAVAIVVLFAADPVAESSLAGADAVLHAFYPAEMGAAAVVDALVGRSIPLTLCDGSALGSAPGRLVDHA